MKLLLLPGMDGTGHLFAPLCERLPANWGVQIISYPSKGAQDYPSLTAGLLDAIPRDEDFILLAESFSGPIAYNLALTGNPRLLGIIFVATFLQPPRPTLLWLLSQSIRIIGWIRPPAFFLRRFFLGKNASQTTLDLFWNTVRRVPRSVIAARMKSVLALDPPVEDVNIPCAYIQATDDAFVPAICVDQFSLHCPHLRMYHVKGPHFLLQSNIEDSVAVIQQEIELL